MVRRIAGSRLLPGGRGEPGKGLDPAGLAILTPAVLALILPLVLGQTEHWPAWGWACLAASVLGFAVFTLAERRGGAAGGAAPGSPPGLRGAGGGAGGGAARGAGGGGSRAAGGGGRGGPWPP